MQKIPLGLVFAISVVIVCMPFVYATDKGAEKLVTYENLDYGVRIDYPDDWTVSETDLQPYQIAKFFPKEPEDPGSLVTSIMSIPVASNMSLTAVEQEYGIGEETEGIRIVNKSYTMLSGQPAIQNTYYDYTYGQSVKGLEVLTLSNNNIYIIFYISQPGYFDEYLPVVQEMVKSLEITK